MEILVLCIRYAIANIVLISCLYAAWQCARAWQHSKSFIYQPTHVVLVFIGGIGYLAILRWNDAVLYGAVIAASVLYVNHYTNRSLQDDKSDIVDRSFQKYRKLWLVVSIPFVLISTGITVTFSLYIPRHEKQADKQNLNQIVDTIHAQTARISTSLQKVANDTTLTQAIAQLPPHQVTKLLEEQAVKYGLGFILVYPTQLILADGIAYDGANAPVVQVYRPIQVNEKTYTLVGGTYLNQSFLQQNSTSLPGIATGDDQGILQFSSSQSSLRSALASQEFRTIYLQSLITKSNQYSLTVHGETYAVITESLLPPDATRPLSLISISLLPHLQLLGTQK